MTDSQMKPKSGTTLTLTAKMSFDEFMAILGRENGRLELRAGSYDAAREAESRGLVTLVPMEHSRMGHPYTQLFAVSVHMKRDTWHDDKHDETACNKATPTQPGDLDLTGKTLRPGR